MLLFIFYLFLNALIASLTLLATSGAKTNSDTFSLIRNPIFTQHIILSLIEQELFPSGRLFILNGKPCRKYPGTGFHISIAMVYRNPNFFYHKIISPFFLYTSLVRRASVQSNFFSKKYPVCSILLQTDAFFLYNNF